MILIAALTMVIAQAASQDSVGVTAPRAKEKKMDQKELFQKLVGSWEGRCKTWFEPDKLADESELKGEISSPLEGLFLRHAYEGTLLGKRRRGEETIGFNSITKKYQTSWVDDFHMNYAIMFSEGDGADSGFSVRGEYDVGEDQPRWGWKTEFELDGNDKLRITAYNIHPDGKEAKAFETSYLRIGSVSGAKK